MRKILVTILVSASSLMAETLPLDLLSDGAGLRAENGEVFVLGPKGIPLLRLTGLDGSWSPYRTEGGVAERAGPDALRVTYRMAGSDSTHVSATATFTCRGNRVEACYGLSGPTSLNVGGAMILRRTEGKIPEARLLKMGLWQRHPGGGAAVETNDGMFRRYDFPAATVLEEIHGNAGWSNPRAQHVAFSTDNSRSNAWIASTAFHILPPACSDAAAAARVHGRPFALELSSDRPFNLATNGTTPLTLSGRIRNTRVEGSTRIEASLTVRDFDGATAAEKRLPVTLAAGAVLVLTAEIPPATGAYFAELRASDGEREWFARTTLGAVQPYTFRHRDSSIFGIAASFPQPSRADVDALLRRMGVRWVRNGDTRETLPACGAVANRHGNYSPDKWRDSPEKRRAALAELLEACDRQQNPFLEFGNEWNMSALNTGKTAGTYVNEWLKPLSLLRREGGFKVGLLSMGLAGADTVYLEAIHANGGWPLLDGIAFHPGRGNFTPDYDSPGWTYLGAIRAMQRSVHRYGDKPLWATEAYACTFPHSFWHDTVRRAAENVVLTYTIGLAEGLKAVMFYQLQDGTWHDVGGISQTDPEYHYGLLDRENAVKPSLLAYCAVAEALDGAAFQRYLTFPEGQTRGALFNTPRGPLAVLWDRTEGYIQSSKSADYASPEPWVDHWTKRVPTRFNASGTRAAVIDCAGRRREVEARDGAVTLELTGAPLMVYGLRL